MDQKAIEFDAPEGFQIPQGQDPGKPFDVVCSFEATGEGKKLCMVKFGDMDAPGYKDGEKVASYSKESKPGYGEMAEGIMASGGAGGTPPANPSNY